LSPRSRSTRHRIWSRTCAMPPRVVPEVIRDLTTDLRAFARAPTTFQWNRVRAENGFVTGKHGGVYQVHQPGVAAAVMPGYVVDRYLIALGARVRRQVSGCTARDGSDDAVVGRRLRSRALSTADECARRRARRVALGRGGRAHAADICVRLSVLSGAACAVRRPRGDERRVVRPASRARGRARVSARRSVR
jgi:hypothetical protein